MLFNVVTTFHSVNIDLVYMAWAWGCVKYPRSLPPVYAVHVCEWGVLMGCAMWDGTFFFFFVWFPPGWRTADGAEVNHIISFYYQVLIRIVL